MINKIKNRYNRFAYIYDWVESIIERRLFAKWRRQIISPLAGKILEIGVGTGKNLSYYNEKAEVIAIDFSPKMLARAKKKLKQLDKQI